MKKLDVGEKWMKWTALESLVRTVLRSLQQFIAAGHNPVTSSLGSVAHATAATTVIGTIQAIGGLIITLTRKTKLLVGKNAVLSFLFGILAFVSTILGIYVFLAKGEIGVSSFILSLSILPGAIIDRIFFGNRLSRLQLIGLSIMLIAGYVEVGTPSLASILAFPLWVWISFCIAFMNAINQGLSQAIKDIDMFVKNFWGGIAYLVCGAVFLFISQDGRVLFAFESVIKSVGWILVASGVLSIVLWAANLLSYRDGGTIVFKKLVATIFYIIFTSTVGIIWLGESLNLHKVLALILFIIAYSFFDKKIVDYIKSKFSSQQKGA